MKWALLIAGTLVGIVALVVVIGAMLPKTHAATRTALYHQPPEAVWQAITDYQKFPEWRSSVKRVEPLPSRNGRPAWREVDKQNNVLPMETVVWTPPRLFVGRIADPKLPFGGTWSFEIAASQGGCTLRITENGEIYNPFFRFMARFIFGYTSTMEKYLKDLGKKFGETIVVQP